MSTACTVEPTDSVLLDANLLVLLLLGNLHRDWVGRHRRLSRFRPEDLDVLHRVLRPVRRLYTTPSVLAEVSNLAFSREDSRRVEVMRALASLIGVVDEVYARSDELATTGAFHRLGLTDAAVVEAARLPCVVLTDDFALAGYLQAAGLRVINFNHLRGLD